MRKKFVAVIGTTLVICMIGAVLVTMQEPDRCPLCEFIKSHAPCIVNIETGEVVELALYQPHYTLVGELAEVQEDSTFSFVSAAGAKGTRISSPYEMNLDVPCTNEPMIKKAFCKDCRELLSGYKCGYVLADLHNRGNPVVYPILDGLDTEFRCYEISATYSKEKNVIELVVIGTYHD